MNATEVRLNTFNHSDCICFLLVSLKKLGWKGLLGGHLIQHPPWYRVNIKAGLVCWRPGPAPIPVPARGEKNLFPWFASYTLPNTANPETGSTILLSSGTTFNLTFKTTFLLAYNTVWTPIKRSSCPFDVSIFSSKLFYFEGGLFHNGIWDMEMKADEKFESEAAKRDKDK